MPHLSVFIPDTACSKSHATHGLLGICVSWTPHFKEIVASTIHGRKPPRLLFMGTSQGYCVFKSSTHTLQELQANIQRAVDRISTGTLQNVFVNMIRRVHLCEERNGGHFQHLL
jgi:predicted nuclease of restriction endonuclease-like RecB superfamily